MNDTENPNGHLSDSATEGGILAALPRSRPQRASPRRAAARARSNKNAGNSKTAALAGERDATSVRPTRATGTRADQIEQAGGQVGETGRRARGTRAHTAQAEKKPTSTKTKRQSPKPKGAPTTKQQRRPPKPSKPPAPPKPSAPTKPTEPLAPRQGYEPEEEFELGNTVNPPSGVELVESVADIVGELANSGLAAGGRILKDAFSLLRRP